MIGNRHRDMLIAVFTLFVMPLGAKCKGRIYQRISERESFDICNLEQYNILFVAFGDLARKKKRFVILQFMP